MDLKVVDLYKACIPATDEKGNYTDDLITQEAKRLLLTAAMSMRRNGVKTVCEICIGDNGLSIDHVKSGFTGCSLKSQDMDLLAYVESGMCLKRFDLANAIGTLIGKQFTKMCVVVYQDINISSPNFFW